MPRVPRTTPKSRSLSFIPPLKPVLTAKPPESDQWLHEVKHDGYRTQIIVEAGDARAFTMKGLDWTERYPDLVAEAAKLPCRSAILDGEAVVQRTDGVADFHALRRALAAEPHRVVLFAFDLLHLDGDDLRRLPLVDRRARLEKLLETLSPKSPIQFSEAVGGEGAKFFTAAEQLGLEGIVSKRKTSPYSSGESRDWLKTKCMVEDEFIVVGVDHNPGGPPTALLAREEGGKLAYAGSAFVTLPSKARERFWETAEVLKVAQPAVKDIRQRKVSFVKPALKVRARYLRGEKMLRHASITELL